MAEYQLTATDVVIHTPTQSHIPNDPANRHRVEYEQWLADGGVPDPHVPLEVPPPSLMPACAVYSSAAQSILQTRRRGLNSTRRNSMSPALSISTTICFSR